MNRRPLAALLALTLTAGCTGPPTPNPPANPETTMPPTETPDPNQPPGQWLTDTESEIVRELLAVRAVVKRYIMAVTAKNEAEASQFTCDRKSPGMLWISSMGRPIALLAVTGIVLDYAEGPFAKVMIQVEGKPTSPLTLRQVKGEWCVWP